MVAIRTAAQVCPVWTACATDRSAALLAGRGEVAAISGGQVWGPSAPPGALDYARIKGLGFAKVVAELEEMAKREASGKSEKRSSDTQYQEREADRGGKLFSALAAHLRLDRGTVAEAERRIRRHSPAWSVLIDGPGSAGTPACHAVLARLLSDGAVPAETRTRLLQSTARTQHPDEQTVAMMRAVLAGDPYNPRALYALDS